MFNFAKGTKKKQEQAAKADDYLQPDQEETSDADQPAVETELSIPDDWGLTEEDRYVYAFHNSQSPKLHQNQISIYGMEVKQTKKGMEVAGLIRNTVTKAIQFGETRVLLLGSDQKPVARKTFDLSQLGSIPANGARPWTFVFEPDMIVGDTAQLAGSWSLAFELKKSHQLDLENSWEESINEQTRASLETIVKQAPKLKPGEMNFMGVQARQQDNGDIAATILIRNGAEKNIHLEQVPLGLKDASGEEVARGSFQMTDFTIRANTSKPWTFIFPARMIIREEIDLSEWSAYPIQQDQKA
ncbi:accessory Sec system S-layer assembly protein [Barrientosiimonas marina]|uniref:Accessory Sec system S-layer assembly protein n=1 Tax=Lentibacillus kimchii TaxID=1542911 RepID=A0ABW2UTS2_9BACI